MGDFRGSRQWDWRQQGRLPFVADNGQPLDEIKVRALTVLRSCTEGACLSGYEIEGPLWALVDVSHGSEAVKAACQWFQVAAAYSEDEELRLTLCREAYGMIERGLRYYLSHGSRA